MTEESALTAVLAAEHAAVYGYGLLGARLDAATRELARRAFDAHRGRRNAVDAALRARALTPPATAAAYDVDVTDRTSALRLAIRLETDIAVLWRDLVGSTDDAALRRTAIGGLQETAVLLAQWRRVNAATPLVDALPGTVSP